jgi:uncharacterized membrane protein YgcG
VNRYQGLTVFRPWWAKTPALLGMLALVAGLSAIHVALGFFGMLGAIAMVWVFAPWKVAARIGATFVAFVLMMIGAGVTGQLDDKDKDKPEAAKPAVASPATSPVVAPSTPPPAPAQLADFVRQPLNTAEQQARALGYEPGRHDASEQRRPIDVTGEWLVCFQQADPAAKSVQFGAVRSNEPCPERDGGPLWPQMPSVVGNTYNAAIEAIKQAKIDPARVTVDDVYLDISAPTPAELAQNGDTWRVCFQDPAAGNQVVADTQIRLDLGQWTDADLVKNCPAAKNTTYKIPANDPSYGKDDKNSTSGGSTTAGGGSTGGTSPTKGSSTSGGGSSSTGGSGSTGGGGVGTVRAGSFCSPAGATGVSSTGKPMVCGPASDGRNRWHSP